MLKDIEEIKDIKSLTIKILNYFFKKNLKQLISIIFMIFYFILIMLLGDFMIFKTLGFSTQSIINFMSYSYEFKDSLRAIVLLLFLLSIIAIIVFIVNNFATNTSLSINFKQINKLKKSREYSFRKNFLKKLFKINLFLIIYICIVFVMIGILGYLKFMSYPILYIIFIFISNLYLLSYLYKQLIIIDNNFFKLNNLMIKSIMYKNFYLLLLSILLITPIILSFFIGIVTAFTTKLLMLIFPIFLSSIILSLSIVFLFYDNRLNIVINNNLKPILISEVKINSNTNKVFGILILLFGMYFHINNNTKFFLSNIANYKNETSDFTISLNLILNAGLIDKTKYSMKIKTNKIINLHNSLVYKNGYIIIPENNKNVISSNLQITKNQYLYFIRNINSTIIDIFLIKRLEEKGSDINILIDKVSKNLKE